MDGKHSHPLPLMTKILLVVLIVIGTMVSSSHAMASDMPLAAGSPLAGFAFDDRPLLLSVQRNFQMAMLTSASELGRSCGKMEAYGWRMKQSEQQRVNQIFNNTVDRLRGLGYVVEAQTPTSVSRDITLFTADRPDRHFIFMWSAGEIGLVMVLCESSSVLSNRTVMQNPSVQVFPQTGDVLKTKLAPGAKAQTRKAAAGNFTPIGSWVGNYTCEQGQTGGTLDITHIQGERFDGVFRFYPTPKNPYVPSGRYEVYGEYDPDSQRILINPGKWIERPKDYYNTIIVGSFDPVEHTFSGYFQGINGCTSFEAKLAGEDYEMAKDAMPKAAPVKKKHKKKKAVIKTVAAKAAAVPVVAPVAAPEVAKTVPSTPEVPVTVTAPTVAAVSAPPAPAVPSAATVTAPALPPLVQEPGLVLPPTPVTTPSPQPAAGVPPALPAMAAPMPLSPPPSLAPEVTTGPGRQGP